MKVIDARGKSCPIPVIMAKKEITAGEQAIQITVDNKIATQNLEKLAKNSGMGFDCKAAGADWVVTLTGTGVVPTVAKEGAELGSWAVFLTEKAIGTTDNQLGADLVKMYFYTLAQGDVLPGVCIFMNEGVRLLENPEICQSLGELEARGVKLMFCGACLNFYGIADLCHQDNVSNMYAIVEEMNKYGKVIKL